MDWGFIKPNFRLYVISCDNDFKVISVFSGIKENNNSDAIRSNSTDTYNVVAASLFWLLSVFTVFQGCFVSKYLFISLVEKK